VAEPTALGDASAARTAAARLHQVTLPGGQYRSTAASKALRSKGLAIVVPAPQAV